MKNQRFSLFLALCLPLATATCFQPVNEKSTTQAETWDGVLTDNILPSDRQVFIDTDESMEVDDGCAKTTLDAKNVLATNCGSCHDAGGASQGNPRFDFLMDDDSLINMTWDREGVPPVRFVIPGDADNSIIFIRSALVRDMPPVYNDIRMPDPARITYSDGSVLREWIEHCLNGGVDPLGGNTTGAGGAGGEDTGGGAGGAGGDDTGGGAGGDPGGGGDPDGGALAACAGNVADNGICNAAAQPCDLAGQTCTCTQMGGQRRWVCQ